MQTQTVIRAVDYLPAKPEIAEGSAEDLISENDGVVERLFGTTPDYAQPEYEKLWQEVFDADEKQIVAYCLSKGIDVLDDNQKPVQKWRDIAVMLKAIDQGLLSLA